MSKWCCHYSRDQFEEEHASFPVHPDMVAFISLTDPRSPDAKIDPKFKHVLRLKFHDMGESKDDILARFKDAQEHNRALAQMDYIVFPSPEHAKDIADFIKQHRDKTIIAHCEAGVSRSAAVCAVLNKLGWEYKPFFSWGFGHANPLLKAMLLKEFEGECS